GPRWLGMVEEDQEGKRRSKPTERGTPQGGVISPLLANIYLHLFDRVFLSYCRAAGLKAHLVRYADDFVIVMRGGMKGTVDRVKQALARVELKLNEKKCRGEEAREGRIELK